jgi:iron complex transport system ATP-binding protein
MTNPVELKELCIGYDVSGKKHQIFPALSAVAEESELVALVGRNGMGKSTLLRTIIGLQHSLLGSVIIHGKPIQEYQVKEVAKLISYVSTDNVKVGNLKVFDLVSLGRYPYTSWFGTLEEEDRNMVMRSLEMVGMKDFAWSNTRKLSDGERQRVLIARALAQDTQIIVLDEPTAFLDLPNKYDIILLLKELAREHKKTVIYSTHDLSVAIKISDRIWMMVKEEFCEGTPAELMSSGAFDRLFEGTRLKMNRETNDVQLTE